MSDTAAPKESYIDEAKRRIAHLSYKLEQSDARVRKLEYDNAELQRWANDICLKKYKSCPMKWLHGTTKRSIVTVTGDKSCHELEKIPTHNIRLLVWTYK